MVYAYTPEYLNIRRGAKNTVNDAARDTTLKVTADVKDAVNQIGADLGGKTQREVVEYLIGLHRVKHEQEEGRAIPALNKLRHHFGRIEDIYAEWVRTTWDQDERHAAELADLQAKLTQSEQTVYELREELERVSTESETRLQAAQSEVESIREQSAQELEVMRQRLTQALAAQDQASQLAQFAQSAAEEAQRHVSALEERARETDKLVNQLHETSARLQATEQALARIRERTPLEIERATLEVERKYMNLVAELRESLATVREENAQLQVQLAKA